jgi:hypothetical protein
MTGNYRRYELARTGARDVLVAHRWVRRSRGALRLHDGAKVASEVWRGTDFVAHREPGNVVERWSWIARMTPVRRTQEMHRYTGIIGGPCGGYDRFATGRTYNWAELVLR